MAECNIKRGVIGATLMTLVLSAASCGGRATSNEVQGRFLSGASVDSADIEGESPVEARHFEAYKQFHLLPD